MDIRAGDAAARRSASTAGPVASAWAFASALAGDDEVTGRITAAALSGRAGVDRLGALAAVTLHPWDREPVPAPNPLRDALRALAPPLRAAVWAREVERIEDDAIALVLGVDDGEVLEAAVDLALVATPDSSPVVRGSVGPALLELATPLPGALGGRAVTERGTGRPSVPLVGTTVVSVAVGVASLVGVFDGGPGDDATSDRRPRGAPAAVAPPPPPAEGALVLGLPGALDRAGRAAPVAVQLAVARGPLADAPVSPSPTVDVVGPAPEPTVPPAPAPALAPAPAERSTGPEPELAAAAASPAPVPEPPEEEPAPTREPPAPEPVPPTDPPPRDPPAPDPPALDPPSLDPPALDPPALDPPALDPPEPDPEPALEVIEEVVEDVVEEAEAVVETVPAPIAPPDVP